MNKEKAIAKIEQALATVEAQVITPPGRSYAEFVQELSSSLLACVIDPVEVQVTSTCAPEGDFERYRKAKVWGIARKKNIGNWLLTPEGSNEFALGFGEDPMNIIMHGFSSDDALGEWCA